MAKRPKWVRRRPATSFWIKDRPGPSPGDDAQRLTLYLPARILDAAETQAAKAGDETLQSYCERILIGAIEAERAQESLERRGSLAGLDAIANDPEYLVEWNASKDPRESGGNGRAIEGPEPAEPKAEARPNLAASTILRHAGMIDDDPNAFLPALRRAEAVVPDAARELIQALADLEAEHRDASMIDRRLAYALHRLAFEGQVLLTESWQTNSDDPTTLDLLRMVQESVDRVLSGEDIRYYPSEH